MKKYNRSIFIDTSNISIIKMWNKTGVIDGVTTNPQIFLNEGVTKQTYFKIIEDMCSEMKGKSVSVELISDRNDLTKLKEEAETLREISSNITIKIPFDPLNLNSLELMHYLAVENGVSVNATVMMNYEQLVLAAKAMRGTKAECFISLFWGRATEDWSQRSSESYAPEGFRMGNASIVDIDPAVITANIVKLLEYYDNIYLIIGSVRNATMVGDALSAGTNIVTVPPDIMKSMMFSKRAVETLDQFDKAWKDLEAK